MDGVRVGVGCRAETVLSPVNGTETKGVGEATELSGGPQPCGMAGQAGNAKSHFRRETAENDLAVHRHNPITGYGLTPHGNHTGAAHRVTSGARQPRPAHSPDARPSGAAPS